MIPEIGHFALIIALLLATVQCVLPIAGAARGDRVWMNVARPAARAQALFVALAFGCLVYSFISHDFSVVNVASNSNSQLPLHYRVAASWGSHEGSLLLWVLMLAGWTFAISVFSRHLPDEMLARVIGVQGFISVGFLLFMLLTSNPFDRLLPPAADGRDLNPLLQDPGMVFHPPLLYMGYVGFSVAFAFAIAALLGGRLDASWARWSRPWTTLAWCFLTLGIALGSWWAYYELGWGGWWFWDPVENASFMPWLIGTALIHSLAVTEKRGSFKSWTVLLAILAFSLSLLGTFLVRSGVLTSVHAFATDPERGVFILGFLVVVIGASLALFAWRAPKVGLGGAFEAVSRESFLLANNVLLTVACATVLLGTLYPLFLDALTGTKISVGPPYFDAVFVPIMAPLVFLMGIGPLARWKRATLPDLATRLKWAMAVALVAAIVVPLAAGRMTPMIALGIFLATWVVGSTVLGIKERVRHIKGGLVARIRAQGIAYWGMQLAHLGIAVFVVGVTLVKGFEVERDLRMDVGSTETIGALTFRFDGTSEIAGPNYRGVRGKVSVLRDGRVIEELRPEKRIYNVQKMPMTEAAIASGVRGDLYVSLGEPVGDSAWSVRIYLKPFVTWIWGGCVLMALGGLLALADRRYRLLARRSERTIDAAAATLMRRALVFALPLAAFLALALFLLRGLSLNPREVPSPLVGKAAPEFRLDQLAQPGKAFTPTDMRGQVWMLNVWASWCVACRIEHPLLVELAKKQVVPIVGLNYKDKPDDAINWLAQFGDPYTLSAKDRDGRVGIDYGVYGVPETFIIDKAGTIRFKQIGPVTPDVWQHKMLPLIEELRRA